MGLSQLISNMLMWMWNKIIILLCITTGCFAVNQANFTPTSIRFPIHSITLSNELTTSQYNSGPSGQTLTIYQCQSDDCNINLTDDFRLLTLEDKKAIKTGTYRYVTLNACDGYNNYFISKIKGSIQMPDDGNTYYSHTSDILRKQVASYPEEDVLIKYNKCNIYYELQEDFTITDSDQFSMTLMMDNRNVGYGRIGMELENLGCNENEGTTIPVKTMCMGFPHLIPVMADATPIVERYLIQKTITNDITSPNAMIVFFTESSDENSKILGGFVRYYYGSGSGVESNKGKFETSIKRITNNDDGSISFETFGHLPNETLLKFPNFQRTSSVSEGIFTFKESIPTFEEEISYTATRINE